MSWRYSSMAAYNMEGFVTNKITGKILSFYSVIPVHNSARPVRKGLSVYEYNFCLVLPLEGFEFGDGLFKLLGIHDAILSRQWV